MTFPDSDTAPTHLYIFYAIRKNGMVSSYYVELLKV